MTAAVVVDKGQLESDAPVIDYLPEFRLYDDYATPHATPRDLLSHRAGLPGHYAMASGSWPNDRHSVLKGLRYLEPTAGFREKYQYGNLMCAVIGEQVERISGVGWEDYVTRHVFDPLGMKSTAVGGSLENAGGHGLVADPSAARRVGSPSERARRSHTPSPGRGARSASPRART